MRKLSLAALCLIAALLCACTPQGEKAVTTEQTTTAAETAEVTAAETEEITTEETTTAAAEKPLELAEYNINDVRFEPWVDYTGMEFLTDEQQKTFWLADFIYTMYDVDTSWFWFSNPNAPQSIDEAMSIPDTNFYHTGFAYDSVMSDFKSVFSEEILDELMKDKCADYNGEYVSANGARGADINFDDKIEFQLVSSDDSKLEFKVIAYYADPDSNEPTGTEEFNFEMQKTGEHWIFTKFEFWC